MRFLILLLLAGGGGILTIGLLTESMGMLVGGTVMLVSGGIMLVRQVETLSKEEVIDSWSVLIDGGVGKGEQIFKATEEAIKETKAPGLKLTRRRIAPGIASLERREFLVTEDLRRPQLQPYQMFICCRDYGTALAVDWHLTWRPPMWKALLSLLLAKMKVENPLLELDLFSTQDLRSYVSTGHRCLKSSVEELLTEQGKNANAIPQTSRGLLGIS